MLNYNRWSLGGNLLIVAIITILAPLFIGTTVQAQDFGQLLDAVDKLEANLKSLVQEETAAREKAIAELRKGAGQSQSSVDPGCRRMIKREVATLRTKIKGLASNQSNQELAAMANDIEFLKAENLFLRSALDKNAQQYVSVDGEYAAPNDETVAQLTRTVLLLNQRIEDMAAEDKQPKQAASKASGSKTTVNGRLYSHGVVNFDDEDNHSEFGVSRAYITLKSKLADYASLRVTTDLRTIDDKYNITLKYAYLDWQPGFTSGMAKMRLGLQATQYIDQMNKLWGRRYLEKTVGDQRKFLPSSDLGISTIVGFGPKSKYGFASLALLLPACGSDDDDPGDPGGGEDQDTTAPQVIEITPQDGELVFDLFQGVLIFFNEDMNPDGAAGNITLSHGTISNLSWFFLTKSKQEAS